MGARTSDAVTQHLRSRLATGRADDVTDGQLLAVFAASRDEAAFAVLLARHGPMVLATCRRVLGNAADADDAFQASFLVLARRAGSLGGVRTASAFLYGVAVRVARKARVREARRRAREREAIRMPTPHPTADADWRDVRPVIDEELDKLAAHYRDPLVLCCLEGRSREEAARLLGWPEGTVSGRLARAKELLRARLSRRGVTCSAATLTAVLSVRPGSAVPPELVHAALAAACGAAPRGVAELAGGVAAGGRGVWVAAAAFLAGAAAVGGVIAIDPWDERPPENPPAVAASASPVRLAHGSDVLAVTTSSAGWVATAGAGEVVRVWKADCTPAATCAAPGGAVAVAFSPDGRALAGAGFDGVVRVWNVATGELRHTLPGHGESANAIAFAPKGDVLATAGSDGRVRLWDAATGRHLRDLDAHRGHVWGLSFSPDGRELASAGGDQTVRVWEPEGGTAVRTFGGLRGGAYAVEYHPGGHSLAVAADNTVLLLDALTGREVGRVGTPRVAVTWFAFSPDGRSLAYRDGATVRLWEVASGSDRLTLHLPAEAAALAFTPDGRSLVTAAGEAATVWELRKLVRLLATTDPKVLWAHLAGADAGLAFRAVETLAGNPQRGVPIVRERLHAVKDLAERIDALVARLDDDEFETREQASRELEAIGPDTASALLKAAREHPSPEVRNRAGRILLRAGEGLSLAHARAVEVLERAATPEAREVLSALAGREMDSPLKRDAAAALTRLRNLKP
jgi:RNA polymerase sigma factor (sigma-70 family)